MSRPLPRWWLWRGTSPFHLVPYPEGEFQLPTNSKRPNLSKVVMKLVKLPAEVYRPPYVANGYDVSLPIATSAAEYNGGEPGECYKASVAVFTALRFNRIVAEIVHGVVNCRGERILHGWVEVPFETSDGLAYLCVDASHPYGSTRIATQSTYYEALDVRNVRRYTAHDILKIVQSGIPHCGAWEIPLEPCAEMDVLANCRANAAGYLVGNLS